ncbi:MAG: thioredoxin [Candidatus Izimaplasma sp.]|nr:thioredoxin [Candidatus Izimaplasma bacterium]
MAIIYATEENFDDKVKDGKVLVDFYADWCGPCRMLGPVLEEIAGEDHDFQIVKVNVDENQPLAQKFGVRGIPTIMIMKDGEQVANKAGFMPKDALLDWVNNA